MNAETAESLIHSYRPGKPADSRTQKALRFAEQDAELQAKLRAQVQFDEEIIEVIHGIKPPDDLREKLGAFSGRTEPGQPGLRRHMIQPAVLTAVLGVLLLAGIVVFFVKERMEKFPGRESVERILGSASKMTGAEFEPLTTTTGQLGDWLYMRGYDGYEMPPEVAALPVVGARVFYPDGRKVAQAAIDQNDALLYQFHASEFGVQLPPDGDWLLMAKGEWVGAIRQRRDRCLLFTFRGSKSEMREFLHALPKQ